MFWVPYNWRLQRYYLPDCQISHWLMWGFRSVMGISGGRILIALDAPNKYHLTSLATGFLPAVLPPSFPNTEVLYLELRDFKGLPLKCIHPLSSRRFKHAQNTRVYFHSHAQFFLWQKLSFSFDSAENFQGADVLWALAAQQFSLLRHLHHVFFRLFIPLPAPSTSFLHSVRNSDC